MQHHQPHITSTAYTGLNRGHEAAYSYMKRELEKVINSQPTQIRPEDRSAFLEAIFDDLRPGSAWTGWSEDGELC